MAKRAHVAEDATQEEKQEQPQGYVYPVYDKWKVDVQNLPRKNQRDPNELLQVKITAVRIERPDVKIEHEVATSLNAQSHNSRVRYYLKDSITNGHEETLTIQ